MAKIAAIGIALVAVTGGIVGWHFVAATGSAGAAVEPKASPAVPITAGRAQARNVPVYIRGLGTVQANYTVTVRTRVDGQIMQVFFKEGQEVKVGDRLLQIDPRPFQAALEMAQANKQKDEAQLQGAQLDLERYAKLVAPGYQTRQAYDDEKATVGQLEGAVKADQAQIDAAQLNLNYADVRSPIDGRTGARLVDPGNFVQAAQATSLVTITQLKPIFVRFTAPQDAFDTIRESQAKGPLTVLAYASDDKTLLSTGELTLINNQIDTGTGTIQLKGTFQNQDERLWPGEFVNVRLITSVRRDAVTVPAQTLMQGPDGYYAYVIKPGATVERRDVEVSAIQDGLAVVSKGLSQDEQVVVDGQYRLTNGVKVRAATAPQSD